MTTHLYIFQLLFKTVLSDGHTGDAQIIKHDHYVSKLKEYLESDYDSILTHVPLYQTHKRKQRLIGEIDILARKGNYYDIYEVKCSPRMVKARKQLRKIRKVSNFNISRMFFYCGSSAMLIKII
ncbi:hypothetical protein HYV86_02995 [Candidatus Woesearchaeota archaeon]|nr:hypothetical protein [Candidatus Woesearchaeota archaeon]